MSEHEEEGLLPTLYPRITNAVYNSPWAIHPETMDVILSVLDRRNLGIGLSDEQIDERLAMAAAKNGPRRGPRNGVVAVVPVYGPITPRQTMMSRTSGGTTVEDIKAMLNMSMADEEVSAVVLEFDSPGGTVDGVFELADVIRSMRARATGGKPIVAVANAWAASAAYLLASQADELIVTPSGQVGSIGVILPHKDTTKADEMKGETTTYIYAGKNKAEGRGALSDETRAHLQDQVDTYYDMMVKSIAAGRGVTADTVRGEDWGQGRMLLAKKAVGLGMADRVDTLDNTIRRLSRQHASRTASTEASLGAGAPPFADRIGLATEEVKVVIAHARERARLRAEEGRTLSDAEVEALRGLAETRQDFSEIDALIEQRLGTEAVVMARQGLGRVVALRMAAHKGGYKLPDTKEDQTDG